MTQTAFVTGATGLLGNNLVHALMRRGFAVRGLARSREKANKVFEDSSVQIVEGDMSNVAGFAPDLQGVDVVFHTAAFFRDSYKGGSHWQELHKANVLGTRDLLQAAYESGVRRFLHTSSIAVLNGPAGSIIDEMMLRKESEADDYYRSKIMADHEIFAFLDTHQDMFAAMVLPGWMHGPCDVGPTSAGQTVLDFVRKKLPGIPPGTVSLVDARDVAESMIAAAERGRRGERYLVAGRSMTMAQVFEALQHVTGIEAPHTHLPLPVLYLLAAIGEVQARILKKPALLSMATVKLMVKENGRSTFSHAKAEQDLDTQFRPVTETLADEVEWYRKHGWLTD